MVFSSLLFLFLFLPLTLLAYHVTGRSNALLLAASLALLALFKYAGFALEAEHPDVLIHEVVERGLPAVPPIRPAWLR